MKAYMTKAEKIARAWMPGTRQGSNRPAWAHPEDIVKFLQEMDEASMKVEGCSTLWHKRTLDIAWLHDIIEDGKKEDGSPVTEKDLEGALFSFNEDVVKCVVELTHRVGEEKITYLARLRYRTQAHLMPAAAVIVKLADRICNLREGAPTYKAARWARVIGETNTYIVPMLDALPTFEQEWLRVRLMAAINLRPIKS